MKSAFQTSSARSCRRYSRSASFVMKALPAAMMLVFSNPGWAVGPTINVGGSAGLPINGSVAAGSATGNVVGNQLTVNQTSARAVIDWSSFNIDAGKAVHFAQPAAGAVLNRVNAATNASQISGSLTATGMVMLMNPHGVLFNQGSSVNVGALIATTGNIDENTFTNTSAQITGATAGMIQNQGNITATAGASGLVAMVAPSVINQGVITATGGTIALLGSTAATISLNSGLYEFAVPGGATGTEVTNAASGTLNAKTLYLGAGDAANLLSGVINLEGVQQASSAIVVNGNTVVLKSALEAGSLSGNSNTVNVSGTARIQDGVNIVKAGGAVDVYAGTYAEQVLLNKAGLTLTGHDGAKLVVPDATEVNGISIAANNVTVSGMEIAGPATLPYTQYAWGSNRSRGIAVGNGFTGFTISNNNIHDLRNGILIDGRNTGRVADNRIDNTKSAISVQYTDGNGITMAGNMKGSRGNEWGLNLHLNGGTPVTSAPTLAWQQSLLDLSKANAGWSVQDQAYTSSNRTHVNVATNGSSGNQGSLLAPINTIQGGVDAVVTGGTVDVGAGSYVENVNIAKAMTLDGAGSSQTIIKAPSSSSGNAVTISNASNVTLSDLQIADSLYGLQLSGTSNNVTVNRVAFNNNSYGLRNGTSTRADNFRMLNSTITGGLVGVQAYNNAANTASFANALFENVTIDGPSYKGFYFETADNLALRNVTIRNTGNTGDPTTHLYGSAIDINLKYGAFNAITLDNVAVQNSGQSSGNAGRAAVVFKTRGGPGDTAYGATSASLQSVNIIGGSIEGSAGTGVRFETLSNGRDGQPTVTISDGTRFGNNGQDIAVDQTNVDARGAVFVGAADGFAVEDRVVHALDGANRGLVTWNAGNVYVTQNSGSIQRGVDAAGVGNTVNVANASFAEDVTVNARRDLAFNDTRLQSLKLGSGAAGSGMGGTVTAEGAGGISVDSAAPIRLLSDTTLATTGADIKLNGDIQNDATVARGLRLLAGSGATRGNVVMNTGGTAARYLGQLDVSANNFQLASTLWVSGYKIDATGNVALSNSTLRAQDAGAANTLNAGGDVTGSTNSKGTVDIVSGGNIVANITAPELVAKAKGSIDAVLNVSKSAAFESGGATNLSGSAPAIAINAPRGSVSGNFGTVNNTGGGLVNVNGKPQSNQSLSSNTENNRVVPTGGMQESGADGGPVQVAGLGDLALQGGSDISLSTPEAAGEALESGQAVELDMSPRKQPAQKNKKDKKDRDNEPGE